MPLAGLIVVAVAALASFATAWWIRRNAVRLGVVAGVTERSSHTEPTPSGGGVGIVVGGTIGAAFVAWISPWPTVLVALLALAIAAIGFVDDRRPIPAPVRLVAQLLLTAGMIATFPLDMATLSVPPLVVGAVLMLAAVYWINIFNFMDGIDGLAASQATVMLLGAALLSLVSGTPLDTPMIWWMLAAVAATLAMLVLNWQPASIFMGDAGSTYLGFMLIYFAYATIAAGWLNLAQWLILGALFITDATITLLRRAARGEAVFQAHRLHAYQHLARRWKSHQRVTLLAIGINVVWLVPLAWAAGTWRGFEPVAAALAYGPLIVLVAWAGAGTPEVEETP